MLLREKMVDIAEEVGIVAEEVYGTRCCEGVVVMKMQMIIVVVGDGRWLEKR